MTHHVLGVACLCVLLVVPQMTKADLVTYYIQDYPSEQTNGLNTYHVSGTITTDGTIGTLTASDIQSWAVTFDNTYTIQSTDPGNQTLTTGPVQASLVDITVGSGGYLGLFTTNGGLEWNNLANHQTPYSGRYDPANISWESTPSSLGGNTGDPWVIAVAQSTAVPEPSIFAMSVLVCVCGIAYGLARKFRAQSKPRNEP